jgi:aerobic C4-dicarboxylate transport protein
MFMSECRALVNFYGNAVATLVIAKWDGALDLDRARRVLAARTAPDLTGNDAPETAGRPDGRGMAVAAPAESRLGNDGSTR